MNFNNRYNQLLGENDSSIVSGTHTIPSGSFIMYNDTREDHWGGKFKRVDGPKVFDVNFYYLGWYNNKGDLHRIDGPAIEYADGGKWCYVNSKEDIFK